MKDPFQKRPLPAFFAALCFVMFAMFAMTALEEFGQTARAADGGDAVENHQDSSAPFALNTNIERRGT